MTSSQSSSKIMRRRRSVTFARNNDATNSLWNSPSTEKKPRKFRSDILAFAHVFCISVEKPLSTVGLEPCQHSSKMLFVDAQLPAAPKYERNTRESYLATCSSTERLGCSTFPVRVEPVNHRCETSGCSHSAVPISGARRREDVSTLNTSFGIPASMAG